MIWITDSNKQSYIHRCDNKQIDIRIHTLDTATVLNGSKVVLNPSCFLDTMNHRVSPYSLQHLAYLIMYQFENIYFT